MLDLSPVFVTFPILETQRCLLRPVTFEDAPDIFHILGDPQVTRYLARQPMTSLDEAIQRVQTYRATFQEQAGIPWAVVNRAGGQVIGTCVFWNLNRAHFRAEIGYILASDWWGQGLMTEAVSAILTFGFKTMGLHSVEAQTAPENTASRRLLEKLGFVQEGYFRENYYDPVKGCFTDTAVFSLLKASWLNRMGS